MEKRRWVSGGESSNIGRRQCSWEECQPCNARGDPIESWQDATDEVRFPIQGPNVGCPDCHLRMRNGIRICINPRARSHCGAIIRYPGMSDADVDDLMEMLDRSPIRMEAYRPGHRIKPSDGDADELMRTTGIDAAAVAEKARIDAVVERANRIA